jgi:hypothetical protein
MSSRFIRSAVVLALFVSVIAGPAASAGPVIVAAGDIACPSRPCDSHRATARLIGRINPRAVLTLGDNQYNVGALRDFRRSYDPTWGRFKGRTFPAIGNHDLGTRGGEGYYRYFGRRAHRGNRGTYGFNLGRWHLISINSNSDGSTTDSQLSWVRRNLANNHRRCELAYWHHPRWSSGNEHGPDAGMSRLWQVLYRAGVDVVLNGHEHNYERFALLNPAGNHSRRGIRQFTVGTGGRGHYSLDGGVKGSQKRIDDRFGVIRMELKPRSYTWRFVAVGGSVLDRGRHRCHR